MLSDPHRRRDPFSTSWLPLFQPISPARQPLLPPPPSPLWTAKRGADIADPNYREKNSKRRGGCRASRRCNNPPDRRISTPPSPPFFNLFFFSFFLFQHPFLSFSLPPLPFFIHPRKYGRVKRGSPRPSTSATRVSTSLLLAILSLSLSPMRFFSFSLYLATPSKSSSALLSSLFASRRAIGIVI